MTIKDLSKIVGKHINIVNDWAHIAGKNNPIIKEKSNSMSQYNDYEIELILEAGTMSRDEIIDIIKSFHSPLSGGLDNPFREEIKPEEIEIDEKIFNKVWALKGTDNFSEIIGIKKMGKRIFLMFFWGSIMPKNLKVKCDSKDSLLSVFKDFSKNRIKGGK